MKNALWKDIFRDIKKSKGRFFSILSIIALGVMLFTGVKVAPLDMKATADKYYDDYNLMDLRVISTLGLTDEDVSDLGKLNGVEGIYPARTIDALSKVGSDEFVIRIHSMPDNNLVDSNINYLNRLKVVDGRLPENDGECVVAKEKMTSLNLKVGDKITLSSGTDKDIKDSLKTNQYEVVGVVETPYYLSDEVGSSNIGNGTVSTFMFVQDNNFKSDIYTDIYLTVEDSKALNSYSDEYFDVVDKAVEEVNGIASVITERRYQEVINAAKAQIDVAKVGIEANTLEEPNLIILDRKSHYSYVDYENSANSIDKLSNVFPVFFFVVAALVCLTTMTRMVDEQRINIGTLKALGYNKGSIAKKFIVYALFASVIGSIIGLVTGFTILPTVIFDAYNIMYILPKMELVINIPIAMIVTVASVGLTTMAAYGACRIELRETPSVLMRPKAPKEGKRILLERIPFIWNRFNFTGKVTVRNIFRYKKRFLMTIIGIAGSTALLLSGFGIKDSIQTIVDKQFGVINKYDLSVNVDKNINDIEKEGLEEYIKNQEKIKEYLFIKNETVEVSTKDVNKNIKLITPSDRVRFDDFIYLQKRVKGEYIGLPIEGIALTEKLAKSLDVKIGDEINISNSNDVTSKVKVAAIVENYVGHYAYIDPLYYEKLFNRIPTTSEVLVTLNDPSEAESKLVSNDIINQKGVSGVVSSVGIKDNFSNTIASLDLVVLVMVVCAGALSFIVLYNLTNVNISERIREIATIKVLGFYDKEVSAYIFRENILLSIIGTVAGLLLGIVFHRFIMVTVEMENMMFGRNINGSSFIIAAVLTVIFSLLVNWAMYYKLKKVQMVESLKSVD